MRQGPATAIHHSDAVLEGMNDWCKEHHGASGLTQRVRDSRVDMGAAEQMLLDFIAEHTEEGMAQLAGNSVHVSVWHGLGVVGVGWERWGGMGWGWWHGEGWNRKHYPACLTHMRIRTQTYIAPVSSALLLQLAQPAMCLNLHALCPVPRPPAPPCRWTASSCSSTCRGWWRTSTTASWTSAASRSWPGGGSPRWGGRGEGRANPYKRLRHAPSLNPPPHTHTHACTHTHTHTHKHKYKRVHTHTHTHTQHTHTHTHMHTHAQTQTYRKAPRKTLAHTALSDIKESIEELKYYRKAVFKDPRQCK